MQERAEPRRNYFPAMQRKSTLAFLQGGCGISHEKLRSRADALTWLCPLKQSQQADFMPKRLNNRNRFFRSFGLF